MLPTRFPSSFLEKFTSNLAVKVPVVMDILAKQHRGLFMVHLLHPVQKKAAIVTSLVAGLAQIPLF